MKHWRLLTYIIFYIVCYATAIGLYTVRVTRMYSDDANDPKHQ